MAEETNPENQGVQERRIVRKSGVNYATYYVNNTEVGMTSFDLSLRFAKITGADAESLYVEDQAIVTMSLQHAKAVAMILSSYIKQYEKDNGKLFVPFASVPTTQVEVEEKLPTALYEGKPEK